MDEKLYNPAFERSILSSVLMSCTPEETDGFLGQISEDLFYIPAHQNIFSSMRALYRSRKPIDEEFLKMELGTDFDETVMLDVISTNPISNITPYVTVLKDYSRKRKLLQISTQLSRMIIEDSASADDAYAFLDSELVAMEEQSGVGLPITMNEAIQRYKNMTIPPKISTGIRKIDEMLCGGFESTQLVHVGGEKNVGKTTLLKQILFNTSAGFDTLFFSFEMPAWKMAKYTNRLTGQSNLDRYHIVDTEMMKSTDVLDVVRMMRMWHRRHGIRFVLIDSKMKLTHKTYKGNETERRGDIDAILNRVVQELGLVLMMITQLRKDDVEKGVMSNYGSGLSDYEADMQLMMYHAKDGSSAVEIKVTKNRQEVQHEPVRLFLDKEQMKFDDARTYTVQYESVQESSGGVNEDKVEVVVL
jgi:replicative DNA helicase